MGKKRKKGGIENRFIGHAEGGMRRLEEKEGRAEKGE